MRACMRACVPNAAGCVLPQGLASLEELEERVKLAHRRELSEDELRRMEANRTQMSPLVCVAACAWLEQGFVLA